MLEPSIEVFDRAREHALVKVIPLTAPEGTAPVANIRGITASATTQRLYISHYGSYEDLRPGGELSGHVLALVEAWLRPPLVAELERLSRDAGSLRAWWGNRLLRCLLVFTFTTLGAMAGAWVGLYELLRAAFS